MKDKSLVFSRINGGGNFDQSKLALGLHTCKIGLSASVLGREASSKGRPSAFLGMLMVVLFVFMSALTLTACSSDDKEAEDSPAAVDYHSLLTANDWEITMAAQRLKGFLIDQKEADLYCHFSTDSVFFSEGAMVNYFDDEGKVTKSQYEYSSIGGAPYFIKDNQIKIGNGTFTISNYNQSQEASSLILENEEWKLMLKKK